MSDLFREKITSVEELTDVLGGSPGKLAANKVIHHLDTHCKNFLQLSPIVFISTSHQDGTCDVSPRGDHPGFTLVVDDTHLVIPDRPGNKRVDSMRNILVNPQIGLIFLIPGLEETLRINGKAWIIQDKKYLEQLEIRGHIPTLGIGIEIEECFIHCAKALKRSSLWNPTAWPEKEALPSIPKMIADHVKLEDHTPESIKVDLEESYTKRLY
ncbi:pyridoxamine 5'-phosphate oxidase family protein [Bacillus sp. PS06]|nr:pyridoxamine 5'-phosphate oxidase family protein [Bacillus sp. PS06]